MSAAQFFVTVGVAWGFVSQMHLNKPKAYVGLIHVTHYHFRMFFKGQRHGFGRFDFVEDKMGGRGKTMGFYEGEWEAGRYHGMGRIVWGSTGCSYEGEWQNGNMHGRGIRKDVSGTTLMEGVWICGQFQNGTTEGNENSSGCNEVVELD